MKRASAFAGIMMLGALPALAQTPATISGAPQEAARFPDYVRTSQHVPAADGTRLTVDVYRPANGTVVHAEKLPILLITSRSTRPLDDRKFLEAQGALDAIQRGYIVVWTESRGVGASFGKQKGFVTAQNGRDILDVAAWLKGQSWTNGKIGMFGSSNRGFIQWMALGEGGKNIDAMTPSVANPNLYYQLFINGVSGLAGAPNVGAPPRAEKADPVDADTAPDYPLRAAALADHAGSFSTPGEWLQDMTRDQINPATGNAPGISSSPLERQDVMRAAKVPMYQMAGWYDSSPTGQLVGYKAVGGKILIGAWQHNLNAPDEGKDIIFAERRRWFDHILKGADNGIDREPPVRYQTINAPAGQDWSFAADWPLATQRMTPFYLTGGASGTVKSVNDGTLSRAPSKSGADSYKVDLTLAAFDGKFDRLYKKWHGDMTPGIDSRALTYTTEPLATPTESTGSPVAHLWVSSTATDADFIVYVEEVLPDGRSQFVTDGLIRASHRKLEAREPFASMGIPFHRSYKEDLQPLVPGEPVELVFDLNATSYLFAKGSRIRFTVTGAEKNAYSQPAAVDPAAPPTITLLRDKAHPSRVELPLIPTGSKFVTGHAKIAQAGFDGAAQLYLAKGRAYLKAGDSWTPCIAQDSAADRAFACDTSFGPLQLNATGNRPTLVGRDFDFRAEKTGK